MIQLTTSDCFGYDSKHDIKQAKLSYKKFTESPILHNNVKKYTIKQINNYEPKFNCKIIIK